MTLRQTSGAILLTAIVALSPLALAEVVVTESAGTITTFSPESLVIRSEVANAPTTYAVSKEVTYVDDTGAPVSMEIVRSGAPVTVHYVREGDRVLARRVIVHRVVKQPAAVVEERVVRPAAPVVEQRIVRPAPTVQERTTVIPAPTVQERKTTTTTTTTKEKD